MRIQVARIKSYRTIKDELEVDIRNGITLVGPNNTGKTNILKGIRCFFTGYDNSLKYSRDFDLSLNQSKTQTTISLSFKGDSAGRDKDVYDTLDSIRSLLGLSGPRSEEFSIYLTFSVNSNPSYRVFPNSKRPTASSPKAQYSRLERKLVESVLDRFSVHYIPSDKSTSQLYQELVTPFLLRKAFNAISPHLENIQTALQETASSLNETLRKAGLGNISCSFEFPDTYSRIFKEVDFEISDPNPTSIFSKGMGIQSAALLAAFNWITTEESNDGKSVLWLLEEPESYLHPELGRQCAHLISDLSSRSQVVATTHSLGFVPQDPTQIVGVELHEGWTTTKKFKTYHEATARIRQSLGVRFSDYYNLNIFNVLLEGETDREYLLFVIGKLSTDPEIASSLPILTSRHISFLDYGGVKGLEGFVRATYELVRQERPCILMLDGDEAGNKCRKDLQSFFGKKDIPFEANKHFVSVRDRFSVEAVFPDMWIKELKDLHSGWFSEYSEDAEGNLQPFRIKDENKRQVLEWLISKAKAEKDLAWAARWRRTCEVLEGCLRVEGLRLYGKDRLAELLDADSSGTYPPALLPGQVSPSEAPVPETINTDHAEKQASELELPKSAA